MSHIGKKMNASLKDIFYVSNTYQDLSLLGILDWIEKTIPDSMKNIDSDKTGFYFSSKDAGAITAIDFWKEAKEKKIKFANPRNFPATLSNFIAASFATKMNIRGPNVNIVGKEDTLPQLFFHALNDIKKNRIENAIIVVVPSFEKRENVIDSLWLNINKKEGKFRIILSKSDSKEINNSLYSLLKKDHLENTFTFSGKEGIPKIEFIRYI